MAFSPGTPGSTGPGRTGSTEETRMLWRLAGMGFQFGTEIIAGVLLGWFVDRMWGTDPWGVLIGSLIGIAVATLDLLRKALRLNREMDRAAAVRSKRATPQAAPPEEAPEEELTHEQWKTLRDRDLEPNADDDERGER